MLFSNQEKIGLFKLEHYCNNFHINYDVNNFNEEQIAKLNQDIESFIKKLKAICTVLFLFPLLFLVNGALLNLIFNLYTWLIVLSPSVISKYLVSNYLNYNFDSLGAYIVIALFLIWFSLISYLYRNVGHHYLLFILQKQELNNTQNEFYNLKMKHELPKVNEPFSSEVQKEVDLIKTLGHNVKVKV